MPKSYSEEERAYIRGRLQAEAADCLARYGVRRTTVDELVKRAGIPKGTFYLFYRSKELLLFEVIQQQHEAVNQALFAALAGIAATGFSAERLTDAIFDFYKKTEQMQVLRRLDLAEVELLVRRLPQKVVADHLQQDTDAIKKVFTLLPVKEGVDIELVSAAFHAIYYATLHKAEIGEEKVYDGALRALIHGMVLQLI